VLGVRSRRDILLFVGPGERIGWDDVVVILVEATWYVPVLAGSIANPVELAPDRIDDDLVVVFPPRSALEV
jgi:hypothetical protein